MGRSCGHAEHGEGAEGSSERETGREAREQRGAVGGGLGGRKWRVSYRGGQKQRGVTMPEMEGS